MTALLFLTSRSFMIIRVEDESRERGFYDQSFFFKQTSAFGDSSLQPRLDNQIYVCCWGSDFAHVLVRVGRQCIILVAAVLLIFFFSFPFLLFSFLHCLWSLHLLFNSHSVITLDVFDMSSLSFQTSKLPIIKLSQTLSCHYKTHQQLSFSYNAMKSKWWCQ